MGFFSAVMAEDCATSTVLKLENLVFMVLKRDVECSHVDVHNRQ